MNLGFIKPAALAVRNFTIAHSTTILTAVGAAGVVGTSVSASVATVKSYKKINSMKEAGENPNPKEKVKACWKYYIPTAITGAGTIAAIIGTNIIFGKKEAAITAALGLAEKSLEEYRGTISDKLGIEEEKELKDKAVFDKIANTDSDEIHPEWTFETHGKTLCYDYYCGRYFMSDPGYLRSLEGEINRRYLTEGVVMLQEVYDEIGFVSSSWLGRNMGWELPDDMVCSHDCMRFIFDSKLTRDNKPVLVVSMNWDPKLIQ